MVLWEITLATAYFLGLKRTYRLALTTQRRLLPPPNHPNFRHFLRRRTRNVFDVALAVQKYIQQRDIEVGRSLGNWILCLLDKIKPAAQISNSPTKGHVSSANIKTQVTSKQVVLKPPASSQNSRTDEKAQHLFATARNTWPKMLPTISMTIQRHKPVGIGAQYRNFHLWGPGISRPGYVRFDGVVRKDVMQHILNK